MTTEFNKDVAKHQFENRLDFLKKGGDHGEIKPESEKAFWLLFEKLEGLNMGTITVSEEGNLEFAWEASPYNNQLEVMPNKYYHMLILVIVDEYEIYYSFPWGSGNANVLTLYSEINRSIDNFAKETKNFIDRIGFQNEPVAAR